MILTIPNNINVLKKSSENIRIKPFIRWAGGKQNLVTRIVEYFPEDSTLNYFEPFLGAGSLFLASNYNKSVLSDINFQLVNAYFAIKEDPHYVFKELLLHRKKLDKEFYYKVRNLYNKKIECGTLLQAVRFIFLVHTSFNGIYRVNQKGEYNVPVGKLDPSLPTFENLVEIQKKLQNVELLNCSYCDILPKINGNSFLYLDPPYPKLNETSMFQHYTPNKFSNLDQEKVALFSQIASDLGAKVLISNADTPMIRKLYKKWDLNILLTRRYVGGNSNRQFVNELIIKNY